MDRIKSSLELAMERLKKQNDKGSAGATFNETDEYVKASTVLGRSFLQGKTSKEEMGEKLGRYPEQCRTAAVQAFVGELAKEMTLMNTPMVLEAICYIKGDAKTGEACAAVEQLYQQFQRLREKKLALLAEVTIREQLEKLSSAGIKGSAIAGFNVESSAAWQQAREQLEEEYTRELEEFRSSIISQRD